MLWELLVFTIAAFALWNIADMFIEKIRPRKIYQRSFAVYAMHLNVAIIILKILSLFSPENRWLEIPKFMIMIVGTLVIINCVCALLEKYCPRLYALFMGNRVKNSNKV